MAAFALRAGVDRADLGRQIAGRSWFHTIDLGEGLRTPGYDDTARKVGTIGLPTDLTGKTVLDVGAYDGYFAFECERRGAQRVMAVDRWCWEWPDSDARGNFELLRDALGSGVEDRVVDVEHLSPETVDGRYDVVLFLGVLYHAPDPLGYLQNVRSVTGGVAIIETVVDLLDVGVPAAAYYPAASLNGDASNHWGPNLEALVGMVTDAGFASVRTFPLWQQNTTWALHLDGQRPRTLGRRARERLARRPRSGRVVVHATV